MLQEICRLTIRGEQEKKVTTYSTAALAGLGVGGDGGRALGAASVVEVDGLHGDGFVVVSSLIA